ncbi:uncharacterized protein CDAR_580161 [Caerostris darwini]|uniref:Uncharacterized protein n=1 Tax=Caerostris darwini TaxID=1538125 RepID=A0AAV4PR34_9ARAC|nr:uncharacterized protein CDAR_580161 [Caerostris darwini]
MLEDYVSHLLSKNSNMSSAVGIFPPASRGWGNHLHRHLPSPPEESMGEAKAYNLKLGSPTGGALAGQASPPALSPNLPNIVKMEPRLPSPCSGDSYSPTKKTKMEDGTWIPSPSQMSIDSSVSPPPLNGHSPTSSSYDAYCSSKGKLYSSFFFFHC